MPRERRPIGLLTTDPHPCDSCVTFLEVALSGYYTCYKRLTSVDAPVDSCLAMRVRSARHKQQWVWRRHLSAAGIGARKKYVAQLMCRLVGVASCTSPRPAHKLPRRVPFQTALNLLAWRFVVFHAKSVAAVNYVWVPPSTTKVQRHMSGTWRRLHNDPYPGVKTMPGYLEASIANVCEISQLHQRMLLGAVR